MAAIRGGWGRGVAAAIAAASPLAEPSAAATEAAILALRTQGLGPARIALQVAPSVSTVYRTLVRHGQHQLHPPMARLVRRYEKTRPGELVHVDLKYLPALEHRAEFEFAAVDDFTREAVVWIAGARHDTQRHDFSRAPRRRLPVSD